MGWVVVPNLDEARDQLNARFPNRGKSSDGSIGDIAHQVSSSSHNPDLTGLPEYRDGDTIDEVRARDFDKNLNDAAGVTMEDVVQLWVKLARSGQLWWIRYMIYKRRIWHKRDNYVTRVYTGSNPHDDHLHLNSDFTQAADTIRGTNWYLSALSGTPSVPPVINPPDSLIVDGSLGPKTISRWQRFMRTPVDGIISHPNSALVRAVQTRLKATVDRNLVIDGFGIEQNGHRYKTVGALQRYLGSPVDEIMSYPESLVVKALQRRLNENRF